jgi:hypothetical protein
MKNWRTTLSGSIAAIGLAAIAYVQTYPQYFAKWPWALPLAGILAASGVFVNGAVAKDSTTHSTVAEITAATVEKQQESQPAGTTETVAATTTIQSTKTSD